MHAFSAYQLSVKKIWITEKICTSSTSLRQGVFTSNDVTFLPVTIPLILSFLFCDLCLLKPYIILPLPFLLIHPLLLLSLLDHCSSGGVHIFHIPPHPHCLFGKPQEILPVACFLSQISLSVSNSDIAKLDTSNLINLILFLFSMEDLYFVLYSSEKNYIYKKKINNEDISENFNGRYINILFIYYSYF